VELAPAPRPVRAEGGEAVPALRARCAPGCRSATATAMAAALMCAGAGARVLGRRPMCGGTAAAARQPPTHASMGARAQAARAIWAREALWGNGACCGAHLKTALRRQPSPSFYTRSLSEQDGAAVYGQARLPAACVLVDLRRPTASALFHWHIVSNVRVRQVAGL